MNGPAIRGTERTWLRADGVATARQSEVLTTLRLVASLIAGAWFIAILAQVTGNAQAFHHHTLLSSGAVPIWLAVPLSIASWQVMTAAMMLPASLPAVRAVARGGSQPSLVVAAFLCSYAIAWSAFGLAAFIGDDGLHALVHVNPWLAAHPQLISGAVLALAGAYQLIPGKHRALAACRAPDDRVSMDTMDGGTAQAALRAGWRHALDCVASSWALMLLMFAAGFANLLWMAVITLVMTYEAMGRHGHRVAGITGSALLALAAGSVFGFAPGF